MESSKDLPSCQVTLELLPKQLSEAANQSLDVAVITWDLSMIPAMVPMMR